MSVISYFSLPRKPKAMPFQYGDKRKINEPKIFSLPDATNGYHYIYNTSSNFRDDDNHDIGFWEDGNIAVFNKCFRNPFIYRFSFGDMPGSLKKIDSIFFGDNDLDSEAKNAKINEIHEACDLWLRQVLYKFLYHALEVSEFVEIYVGWEAWGDYNFGPPSTEFFISLEDVLNVNTVKNLGEAIYNQPFSEGGHRLVITRTI
ncbi:MAG: hypothetical protein FWE11_05955 [Defluviitaleaceae bacterium]|nr:hypothetical protein [Defluviitaleaceae bacterium]